MAEHEEIKSRLDRFERKIDEIAKAISTIAVQDQRLKTLERENVLLFTKMDAVEKTAASCPRAGLTNQLKAIWVFVAAIVLAIVGNFFK